MEKEELCFCLPDDIRLLFTLGNNTCGGCHKYVKSGTVVNVFVLYYGCNCRKSVIHFRQFPFHKKCVQHLDFDVGDKKGMWFMLEYGKMTAEQGDRHAKVYWKRHEMKMTQCPSCGKREGLKKCKQCLCVKYCNEECQKNDWWIHKKDCRKPKE